MPEQQAYRLPSPKRVAVFQTLCPTSFPTGLLDTQLDLLPKPFSPNYPSNFPVPLCVQLSQSGMSTGDDEKYGQHSDGGCGR